MLIAHSRRSELSANAQLAVKCEFSSHSRNSSQGAGERGGFAFVSQRQFHSQQMNEILGFFFLDQKEEEDKKYRKLIQRATMRVNRHCGPPMHQRPWHIFLAAQEVPPEAGMGTPPLPHIQSLAVGI